MKSIVRKGIDLKMEKKKTSKRIFAISLSLALIALVVSTSSTSSLQYIRPAMAASLSSVSVVPASNTKNERDTYDIFFKTATSGTIKTVVINFPSSFTINLAKLIERSGIGSGSLSASGTELRYTVSSAVSVSSGTTIRLEIGRIIATAASSSHTVSIKTLNSAGGTIDGPTNSGTFTIKSINGNDVSPSFMIRKTLNDDAVGNAHGWNPDNINREFLVTDSDLPQTTAERQMTMVSLNIQGPVGVCGVRSMGSSAFIVTCTAPMQEGTSLEYLITKLPAHVATSSLSVSSSQFTTTSENTTPYESARQHDPLASEFP